MGEWGDLNQVQLARLIIFTMFITIDEHTNLCIFLIKTLNM